MSIQAEPQPIVEDEEQTDLGGTMMNIFKFIVMITGPILVAFGILSFFYAGDFRLSGVFLGIYLVLFGACIFFGEFGWGSVLKSLPWLLTRRYRSVFIVFSGTLCFGISLFKTAVIGYIVGGWTCFIGIVYFILTFCRSDEKEDRLQQEYKEEVGLGNKGEKLQQQDGQYRV
ncbi:MAG: hypothetical protein EZS28_008542 [Streblomastix strix]|uniref:COPI associated protein n=1 Tax=Streblomastix strix TaxID=222440 RepID=A0A5J4WLI2_9EUKA|nr:MAG: hypothetical protein EZS28_008542 [Streblomastix strix]